MTLNWDTEAESVKRVSDHVYFKVLNELASTEEFNKELYGVEDLGVTNYTGTVSFYTREVKLDHGWRRVYCGRPYSKQRWNALLLILHLQALTRSFSRRLLNTVKNKIYYTLLLWKRML
jgi:hypothetical protein